MHWMCWLIDIIHSYPKNERINEVSLSMGVSICLDRVSIETLNLDTGREPVSTVEKISTLSKS
jgi:hypothetical protein